MIERMRWTYIRKHITFIYTKCIYKCYMFTNTRKSSRLVHSHKFRSMINMRLIDSDFLLLLRVCGCVVGISVAAERHYDGRTDGGTCLFMFLMPSRTLKRSKRRQRRCDGRSSRMRARERRNIIKLWIWREEERKTRITFEEFLGLLDFHHHQRHHDIVSISFRFSSRVISP